MNSYEDNVEVELVMPDLSVVEENTLKDMQDIDDCVEKILDFISVSGKTPRKKRSFDGVSIDQLWNDALKSLKNYSSHFGKHEGNYVEIEDLEIIILNNMGPSQNRTNNLKSIRNYLSYCQEKELSTEIYIRYDGVIYREKPDNNNEFGM